MTAHRFWDSVWRTAAGRADWSIPDPWVAASAVVLRSRGLRAVLDLGCGVGRHVLHLSREGFAVQGLDRSPSAVAIARERAGSEGVRAAVVLGDVEALPYRAASFDAVLAFNVVYHADEAGLRRTVAEVRRVLRPSGIYLSTMLSKQSSAHGRGTEVSPNTFCQPDATDDKVHPHLYADANDLVRLHDGFRLVHREEHEQTAPGSFHWYCRFEAAR